MYALGVEVSSRAGRRGFRSGSMEQWGWILKAMKSLLPPLLYPGFWTRAWAMFGSLKLQNLVCKVIQNKLDLHYGVPPLCQNTGLEKDLNLRLSPSCTESSKANKHANQNIASSWSVSHWFENAYLHLILQELPWMWSENWRILKKIGWRWVWGHGIQAQHCCIATATVSATNAPSEDFVLRG